MVRTMAAPQFLIARFEQGTMQTDWTEADRAEMKWLQQEQAERAAKLDAIGLEVKEAAAEIMDLHAKFDALGKRANSVVDHLEQRLNAAEAELAHLRMRYVLSKNASFRVLIVCFVTATRPKT